ncbi:MAG: pyridoxamine 5'-phosphate oxidase family protein [Deltaproteobacteria bacterium]|nr:pyridoxamine 5'-phosphate oxidase family protein [Deltaproteobacteria bacterium]MCW5809094.1 pyridoxamine 5'-phosphate oxidase family protein [Deltaproteobacteria bacterium]
MGWTFDDRIELNRGTLAGPEVDDATVARRLVACARLGSLATVALRPAGYPYASLVAMAAGDDGTPILLLSGLAEHAKNLAVCAKASLLVTEPNVDDIVAAPRVTIAGECTRLAANTAAFDDARARYLAVHPEAADWFADHLHSYALYLLEPVDLRVIVGFGRLSWVEPADFRRATP